MEVLLIVPAILALAGLPWFLVCLLLCFIFKPGTNIWLYCYNVCISYDQWVNSALGGDHDQTISARAGIARNEGSKWGTRFANFIDWLFSPLEKNHCEKAILFDQKRPKSYETVRWD